MTPNSVALLHAVRWAPGSRDDPAKRIKPNDRNDQPCRQATKRSKLPGLSAKQPSDKRRGGLDPRSSSD
ncbi:MAG: hypothetical protein N2C14_33675 [Planctomycetales bacterium]